MKKIIIVSLISVALFHELAGVCLKSLKYQEGYPVLELWNKEKQPLYYHITQNYKDFSSAGRKPDVLAGNSRVSGWAMSANRKSAQATSSSIKHNFDIARPTYIGIYANNTAQQQPIDVYQMASGKTMYLTWQPSTKDAKLYPQTGPQVVFPGVGPITESCLNRSQNIAKLEKITHLTPAAIAKEEAIKAAKRKEQQQLEEEQKHAKEYILGNGPCDKIFTFLTHLREKVGTKKNIFPGGMFKFDPDFKDMEKAEPNFVKKCLAGKPKNCNTTLNLLLDSYERIKTLPRNEAARAAGIKTWGEEELDKAEANIKTMEAPFKKTCLSSVQSTQKAAAAPKK